MLVPMSERQLKFIVDSMLGDIARWLRMLGYDTLYYKDINDNLLISIAKRDGRILITRDKTLFIKAKRKGLGVVYLGKAQDIIARLITLCQHYSINLKVDPNRSRCPICNGILKHVEPWEVKGKVDDNIKEKYSEFWLCTKCGKVYWKGTHWITIEKILLEVKRRVKLDREDLKEY